MAITNATRLADFGSGIGTAGAIIQVDNTNQRVGIGTTNPTTTLEVKGTLTATSFEGSGANLTGVSGFATALSTSGFGAGIFKTREVLPIAAGTSESVSGDDTTGNVVFTRVGRIDVGVGATLTISTGTTMFMNVLNVFP